MNFSHAFANEYIAAVRPDPPDHEDDNQKDMPFSRVMTSNDELQHSCGEKVEGQVFDKMSQQILYCYSLFYRNSVGAFATLSQLSKLNIIISLAENKSLTDCQRQWWEFKPKHMDKDHLNKEGMCFETFGLIRVHRADGVHSNGSTKVDNMSVETSYNISNFMSKTRFHLEDKVIFEGLSITERDWHTKMRLNSLNDPRGYKSFNLYYGHLASNSGITVRDDNSIGVTLSGRDYEFVYELVNNAQNKNFSYYIE